MKVGVEYENETLDNDKVLEYHRVPQKEDSVTKSGIKWCSPKSGVNKSIARGFTAVYPKQRVVTFRT